MGVRDYFLEVSAGTIPADYSNSVASNLNAGGEFIRFINGTNQDVEVEVRWSADNNSTMRDSTENLTIKAGDRYTRPMRHSGGVRIRHKGIAPSSGTMVVNSWSATL
jgi:hypothetical protein